MTEEHKKLLERVKAGSIISASVCLSSEVKELVEAHKNGEIEPNDQGWNLTSKGEKALEQANA